MDCPEFWKNIKLKASDFVNHDGKKIFTDNN